MSTPEILWPALRQYRHNTDNSPDYLNPALGFVNAFDYEEVVKVVTAMQEEIAALRESLGLLQIGHDHKATLLASCEIALGERDEKISTLQSDLAAAKESRDRESVAYDKLNNAFIDLNLDCDKLKAELARAREALIKIADWNGAWGTFPETNPQWAAMAVMTAREIAHKGEEG